MKIKSINISKIVSYFIVLQSLVPSMHSMESKFSLSKGIKKTFQSPWTYAIPGLTAVLLVGCELHIMKNCSYYYDTNYITSAAFKSIINPINVSGLLGTVIKNSFSEQFYKKFPSVLQVVLDHPYLTATNCASLFSLYNSQDYEIPTIDALIKLTMIATGMGTGSYLMYDWATKK